MDLITVDYISRSSILSLKEHFFGQEQVLMSKMIIVGAGASAAIDASRFPTMDNFFQGVLDCAKIDEDKNLIANFLSILDCEDVFVNKDVICKNLSARWRQIILQNKIYQSDSEELRNHYLDALGSRFFSNAHSKENLEGIVAKSLSRQGSSYTSILFMINWLLGNSDVMTKIEKQSQDLYHKLFDTFIGNERQCSIVSFNYDLLIDRALISWLEKSMPITDTGVKNLLTREDNLTGHWSPYEVQILDNDRRSPESTPFPFSFCNDDIEGCEGLRLVKPHGSLSFTQNSGTNENNETCLLIEAGNTAPFPPVKQAFDHKGRNLQPLIVPPTQNKITSHPILFEAERHFIEKLSSPDMKRVAIIGWSLPPTDKAHENIIRQCISNRTQQIEELIIIDLKSGDQDPYFDRMKSIFNPKSNGVKKYWEGFNEAAIEKCF